jgi:toxin ParE1/3/4
LRDKKAKAWQVEGLARSPESGRLGRVEGARELVIQHTPDIAAYRIDGDTVRILRALNGTRQWPEEMREGDEPG